MHGPALWLLAGALALSTGCVSRHRARDEAYAAFLSGQQQTLEFLRRDAHQQDSVFVRGPVNHPIVEWHDGLTLAQAIVAAEHQGRRSPRTIVLIRQGQAFDIDPKLLLRGVSDPRLTPGDIIELK